MTLRIYAILLMFWGFILQGWSSGKDDRTEAARLNKQLNVLLAKLKVYYDSTYYYQTVMEIVQTAVTCDEHDNKPNVTGKRKIRFRSSNALRTGAIWEQLLCAGVYYQSRQQDEKALAAYELYVQTAEHPLFDKHLHRVGEAALYASRLAYGIKDYQKAEHYADIALKDDRMARKAAEIKTDCMRQRATTVSDWKLYEAALLALHERDGKNPHYFDKLVMYYTDHNQKETLKQFVNQELGSNLRNKMAWALKGEWAMSSHQWQPAIEAYTKAAEIDSLFLPVIYNLGICYTSEAIGMIDSLTQQHDKLTPEETVAVKAKFSNGKIWLERARTLDPHRTMVDWAPPLYQIYFALDDERAEEMRKLIKY